MRSECVGIGIALLISSGATAFADSSPPAPAPGAASAPPSDPAAQYPAQPPPGAVQAAPTYPPPGGQGYPQQVPAAYPPGYPQYAPYPPPPPPEPTVRTANNALYVEGLGQGLFYSINYDRAFGDFSARVGVGYIAFTEHNESPGITDCSSSSSCTLTPATSTSSTSSFLTIPLSVSYLGIGSKKHIFEVGAGMTILHVSADASGLFVDNNGKGSATTVLGDIILGYRLQPPNGGFFLRAGLSPLISRYGFWPWPYLGIGATL